MNIRRCLLRVAAWVSAVLGVLVLAFLLTLAMPVEMWRTGEQDRAPLPQVPPDALPPPARRIWIDTDAACGAGARVDPDDCFAVAYLALHEGIEIAGVSTVFGNAPLETTDATARELAQVLAAQGGLAIEVHRGASRPRADGGDAERLTAAGESLAGALSQGPLTVVALGPVTNIAAVLEARPALSGNVEHVVAVMGRRPGHIFHPSEGGGAGSFLGHGPVFRDFNVAKDPAAVQALLAADVPLVLIPYEAARGTHVDADALDRMAVSGPAGRWVAGRARNWLEFWIEDIGQPGFYPFDLLAAVFVAAPQRFACAAVNVRARRDDTVFFPFNRRTALLVTPGTAARGAPQRLYCDTYRDKAPLTGGGS